MNQTKITERFTIAKKGCRTTVMMAPQTTVSRKGRMIPMHQIMSRKITTILRMVSIKGNLMVWFIRLTSSCFLIPVLALIFI